MRVAKLANGYVSEIKLLLINIRLININNCLSSKFKYVKFSHRETLFIIKSI